MSEAAANVFPFFYFFGVFCVENKRPFGKTTWGVAWSLEKHNETHTE
jgi:hypothetical protein